MAEVLSGNSGSWKSFGPYNAFAVYMAWSATQNTSSNYSDVTVSVYLKSGTGYFTAESSTIGLEINGTPYDETKSVTIGQNSQITLKTIKVRVPHGSDGKKTFNINFNFSNSFTGSSGTSINSYTLKSIPRGYDFATSATVLTLGTAYNVKVTDNGSGLRARLSTIVGNTSWVINDNMPIGSNYAYTPSINDIAPLTPNSTTIGGVLRVTTYNGSTKVDQKDIGVTFLVPGGKDPTISSVAQTELVSKVKTVTGSSTLYIANISQIQLTTTASGILGSTIKEYNVSVGGLSFTSASNTQTIDLSQYTIGTGSIVATITATDSRGRKISMDVTLNVQAYSPPMLKNFKVTRNMDLNTTINIVKTVAVSSIKNGTTEKNTYTIVTKYKKTVDTDWITAKTETNTSANFALTGMAIESSYDVQVTITDKLSQPVPVQSNVPSIFMIMSWSATTVGIGKAAEQGVLDIAGKLSDIYVGGISLLDLHYPIGEIKTTTNSQNPSATIGGTWERYAKGKVLIGVDESDTDFATAGTTGGSKTNTHSHSKAGDGGTVSTVTNVSGGFVVGNKNSVSSTTIPILPPYVTVYIWRRIA